MVIKMLTELGRTRNEHSWISTEIENIKKNPSELNNTKTKIKKKIEEINCKLDDAIWKAE